jgi:hypothetical protein
MKLGRKSDSEVRKKLVHLGITVACILLCSAGAFYEIESTWGEPPDKDDPGKRWAFHEALYW